MLLTLFRDDYTEQTFKGKKIVVHPEYYPFSIESEVALLELDRPATLDSFVNIACLPGAKDNVSDGKSALVYVSETCLYLRMFMNMELLYEQE